ncbi:MAG TPA: Mov34/MPN/PAD-1 family protein [Thermoanaerobaculia bacterium]
MRRHVVVIAAIALESFGCAVESSLKKEPTHPVMLPGDDVATRREVAVVLREMFGDAGFGLRHAEEAAFVVANGASGFVVLRWPSGDQSDTARWIGPMPAGVVAIVHTHPNWQPLPSNIDIRTAKSSRLPVYVVTRDQISKTAGGSPEIVFNGDWRR